MRTTERNARRQRLENAKNAVGLLFANGRSVYDLWDDLVELRDYVETLMDQAANDMPNDDDEWRSE